MRWADNKIQIDPPRHPKKITGTRLAAIMGLNRWTTPFAAWCEITKTYQEPFEDTIYTLAGKTIEPKQAEYMKRSYMMRNLITPTDVYGENYFQKTYGDFFANIKVFGGMWDYLLVENDKPVAVLEMKTTKRAEDWANSVPEYYSIQAALYAHLLGVDQVYMVASFLEESDYEHPELFTPTVDNTLVVPFKMSEAYPSFKKDYIDPARAWYDQHVLGGISPEYDEKKDAAILKELRKQVLDMAQENSEDLLAEAEALRDKLDAIALETKELQDRYDSIMKAFKEDSINTLALDPYTKTVEIKGKRFTWTVSRESKTSVDSNKLKADGLFDKYSRKTEQFVMRYKQNE